MIRSILYIIGFYIANWIGKSIFYSYVDGSTTIESIAIGEWYLAGGIGIFICLACAMDEYNTTAGIVCSMIFTIATFVAAMMPFSWGLAILYNLIGIVCIGRAAYKY